MRRQYHFWPAASGEAFDAWDVERLIALSAGLPRERLAVADVTELDTPYWSDGTGTSRTIRQIVGHARLILDVEVQYPVILGPDGRVMDGMHRIARALLEERGEIEAVRFPVLPDPDHRGVRPSDLQY